MLPPAFVTALEMSAHDHMRMSAAVQPFVDTRDQQDGERAGRLSVRRRSRTCTSRRGRRGSRASRRIGRTSVLGAVLEVASPAAPRPRTQDSRRRRSRSSHPARPHDRSRRSRACAGRAGPSLPNGNPCWTYVVRHPLGDFAVFIGHIENGGVVSVRGVGQRRRAAARPGRDRQDAVDGHARRRSRVARHEALRAAEGDGDDGFEMAMPPDGRKVRVPSLVSGFAR